MIDVAREKAARTSAAVRFEVALIEHIPFPAEHFDAMLQHGASKGWYDADRKEIKAHVEWIKADESSIESGPPD